MCCTGNEDSEGSLSLFSRVQLRKRRGRTGKSAMNSKLIVKHRDMTEDEVYAQVCCYILYSLCGLTFWEWNRPCNTWHDFNVVTVPILFSNPLFMREKC